MIGLIVCVVVVLAARGTGELVYWMKRYNPNRRNPDHYACIAYAVAVGVLTAALL